MLEDLTRPGTTPRGTDGRTATARARTAPFAPIQGLQWLRQRVLERLDALEALARRCEASPAPAEVVALERALQQRLAEVEESRRQIRAEAERQEKEWSASLTQLEADRRRLAEAWERVERQRIEGPGAPEGLPHPLAQGQWTPRGAPAAILHAAAPPPARAAVADPDPYNPVAAAILREFQTLSRDVRFNAEARRDSS
jgi:hypothetical protein